MSRERVGCAADRGRFLTRSDRRGAAAAARVLRPGGWVVITTWERRGSEPADLPASYSIADAGALAEAAGLQVLAREERDDWLGQERVFYQSVVAEDSDKAESALRLLAEEGRDLLPRSASARRLLLVARARPRRPSAGQVPEAARR